MLLGGSSIILMPCCWLIRVYCVLNLMFGVVLGYSEASGKRHLEYSKFSNNNNNKQQQFLLSSRTGMLVFYTPSFLVAVASLGLLPDATLRSLLVSSALTIHFFKRIYEVLFVHKFSGGMAPSTAVICCLGYLMGTTMTILSQHLARGLPEPTIDTKYPGIVLFFIGLVGNFYHHYLLSKMRSAGDKGYKIPKGGLFGLVICPHYLCEIVDFWGMAFISQTLHAFVFALAATFYLMGRSYTTWRWYLSKFEDFPKNVKAIIPFVF